MHVILGNNFFLIYFSPAIFLEVENHVSDRGGNLPADNMFGRNLSMPLKRQGSGADIATVNDFQLIKVLGKGRFAHHISYLLIYMSYSILCVGSFGKVYLVRPLSSSNHEVFAMKVLRKNEVIKRHQVEHTLTERVILNLVCMYACMHEFTYVSTED